MASSRRKLILGLGISLDGYIARPDGSVDFLFIPKDYSMADFINSVDVTIMGRKTFDAALTMGGSFGEADPAKTWVCSTTQPAGVRQGVTFTKEPPAQLVAKIRESKGKHIWLMGGGEIAREFLKADAVDEMHIGMVPTLLGEGLPLFPSGFPQRQFRLLENRTYSKGLVVLKYARSRSR